MAVFRKAITLTYNGNNSTSGGVSTQTSYLYYNNGNTSNASFTVANNGFAKTDYKFNIWALGSTSGVEYAPGSTLTLSSNSTLYALWTIVNLDVLKKYTQKDWSASGSTYTFTVTQGSKIFAQGGTTSSGHFDGNCTAYSPKIDITPFTKLVANFTATTGYNNTKQYLYLVTEAGTITLNSGTTDVSGLSGEVQFKIVVRSSRNPENSALSLGQLTITSLKFSS